ncbi:aldose 1-epimerase family protein [Pelosinus fermentans]|uniref:Aldose 1-epimerase n=1 Tax=Pelosinus fermentans JBW45 TaxID=1192197 RepID=I9DEH8_9FIRM|nr:aldose 1-epimerase family protein [Pelosinus fermentans]AJQ28592.1 Aldose 1-epimerase [Pelosinus fermentans JBW45]
MIAKLENQFVSVEVQSKGAELYSLILKEDSTEYLWQADPRYWPRRAPVCFPIVGILPNGQYKVGGETFALSVHGFARDMEFDIIENHPDEIIYRLTYDTETLGIFPFRFQLDIGYRLIKNELSVEYKVKNLDDQGMHFSIGAHPGFMCPILPEENFTDYQLIFEKNETAYRNHVNNGLLSGITELVLQEYNTIPLTKALFKNDVLIFKNLKSEAITLKSQKSGKWVTVAFKGFPYLGIWTKPDESPFVCIEPWYGVTDTPGDSKQFSEKEGIQVLLSGQEFNSSYRISIG